MKFKNNKSSKFIKFLNGKAFYAVLVLCFLGIGIAAWSGVQGIRSLEEPKNDNSSVAPLPSAPENDELEDEPDEDNSTPEQTIPEDDKEETQTDKETDKTDDSNDVAGYSDTELQYSMTFEDMRLHKGIDIAAKAGTPVVAAGKGTVLEVSTDAMLGSYVLIDHGNGIKAKYCGLNAKPTVSVGDTVDSSTQLGTVDVIPAESVEERHLHIEVTKNDKYISPLDLLAN